MRLPFIKNIAIIIGLLFSGGLYAQLSGTYTIGGSSPNYSSISAAVTAMDFSGISGSVTFNIREGVYNEQVSLNQVLGASSSKIVTFQSDPANSSKPVLKFAGSAVKNYVWEFNGSDNVILKNLVFQSLDPNYSRVISYKGSSNFNKIEHCTIKGNLAGLTGDEHAVVYHYAGSSNLSHGNIVDNCLIEGGSYGFYFEGSSANSREDSNKVLNSTIRNYISGGIWAEFQTKFKAENNRFVTSNSTAYTSPTSILMEYCYTFELNNNFIHHRTSAGRGIGQNYGSGNKVYNNMISMSGTGSGIGISSFNCSSNEYYFNSIYIKGNSSARGFNLQASGRWSSSYRNNSITNNAIHMAGGGYVMQLASGTYHNSFLNNSNYNCMYTTGSIFIKGRNSNYTSISTWRSVTGYDGNSITSNPQFYSSTNLHSSGTTLSGKGKSTTGYTDDFDGDSRASNPDIGADEYSAVSNDAGIISISDNFCPGSDSVFATFRNHGTNSMTSVQVGWATKEGSGNWVAQTPISWSGSLGIGATQTVSLGIFQIPSDTNLEIKAYTYNPNSGSDNNKASDTMDVTVTTKMSGTYTAGGINADYSSPISAFGAVEKRGVCGPVTILVQQGTYLGRMFLRNYSGADSTNRVTIKSDPNNASPAVLSHTTNNIYFGGANYVTIEGFKFINTSAANQIYWGFPSSGCEIKNNHFVGIYTTSTSQTGAVIKIGNHPHVDMVVSGNTIEYGATGIYAGNTSTTSPNGITISNNIIKNPRKYGIYVLSMGNLVIEGNSIVDSGNYNGFYSIYLKTCNDIKRISNNVIENKANTAYGIYFDNCQTSNAFGLIYNNIISLTKAGSYSQYAMYFTNSSHLISSYNSIRIASSSQNSAGLYTNSGNNLRWFNNNIYCNKGRPIYTPSSTIISHCDYNNYYTGGSYISYWAANQSTLAALKNCQWKKHKIHQCSQCFYQQTLT